MNLTFMHHIPAFPFYSLSNYFLSQILGLQKCAFDDFVLALLNKKN